MMLHLSTSLFNKFLHHEQGSAVVFPHSLALLCKNSGRPYKSGYSSIHVGGVFTLCGVMFGNIGKGHSIASI